ncbi:potassium channel family protein [Tropicimonas sp. S265A]|uniref:potassium channel family protein n=1 Tax=Tropicimonas sp. S265A TaxID=3415134 RepID=UPI003C7D7AFB
MTMQIVLGTLYLSLSTLFHVAVVAASIPVFHRLSEAFARQRSVLRNVALISFGLVALVFAHTVQIWFWAGVYDRVGAFEDFPTSFYFATVTYTTLGYGDLVLGPALRIFATFGAITGLLAFGISTAFLIALLNRLFSFQMPLDR